jgi:hypothetical protein
MFAEKPAHTPPFRQVQSNPFASTEFTTRKTDFGRISNLGTLSRSRSEKGSVNRNRPKTYEFRLSSRRRVTFTLRNRRILEPLNLNLDGANNIRVDLFRSNSSGRRFLFEVQPRDERSRRLTLNQGTYRLRLRSGGTRRSALDFRLSLRPSSTRSFDPFF